MDIGKITPGFEDGSEESIWRVPIAVFNYKNGEKFAVKSVYEDEGFLCIDIEVKSNE